MLQENGPNQSETTSANDANFDIAAENQRLKAENGELKVQLAKIKGENEKLTQQHRKMYCDWIALKRMSEANNKNYAQTILKHKLHARKSIPKPRLFDRFESEFDANTLERLKRIDNSKKRDSTFILECMRNLCRNKEQLKNVTACGRKNKAKQHNSILSLDKREILDDMFIERLSIEKIDEVEVRERYLRLNTLINSAICNIVRVSGAEVNVSLCIYLHFFRKISNFSCFIQSKNVENPSKASTENSPSKNGPNETNAIGVSQEVNANRTAVT